MCRMFAFAFSVIFSFAAIPQVHAATGFCDNFKSPTDPAWGNQLGTWQIKNHSYFASAPGFPTYTDLVDYQSLKNFSVSLRVNDVYDGGIWLRSRWNGSISGVLLVVGGEYSNYTGLYWVTASNGNVSGPQGSVILAGLAGSAAKIKIVVKGNTYSAYVNGSITPATTLTDNTFKTGSVGLYDNSSAPQETFSMFCLSIK